MFKSLSLKVILFGFIFTFFSSFGQSYFIGIFNSSIRADLLISHGQFGTIYASATLLSSLILIWIGKKIEDKNNANITNKEKYISLKSSIIFPMKIKVKLLINVAKA